MPTSRRVGTFRFIPAPVERLKLPSRSVEEAILDIPPPTAKKAHGIILFTIHESNPAFPRRAEGSPPYERFSILPSSGGSGSSDEFDLCVAFLPGGWLVSSVFDKKFGKTQEEFVWFPPENRWTKRE